MVSPDILGATAGAGFGASLAILLGLNAAAVQIFAFCAGLVAVALSCAVGIPVSSRGSTILPLVLSGIVISALLRADISLIKTSADPFNKLPTITFWLLGSLSAVKTGDILYLLVLFFVFARTGDITCRAFWLAFKGKDAGCNGKNRHQCGRDICRSTSGCPSGGGNFRSFVRKNRATRRGK
jgi:ABC-type Fe3+-siderophore transport system permease subunit